MDWGYGHSLVLDAEGGVAGWSLPGISFLFCFPTSPRASPIALIAACSSHSAAIDAEGNLWVWTSRTDLSLACFLPQRLVGVAKLPEVACGYKFLVAEAEEGF